MQNKLLWVYVEQVNATAYEGMGVTGKRLVVWLCHVVFVNPKNNNNNNNKKPPILT